MRRLFAWLLVTLGIAALVRKLRRREEPELAQAPPPASTPTPTETAPQGSSAAESAAERAEATSETPSETGGDPAAELRERLARSRADMPSSEDAERSVEDRRDAVHEQGRATLDEMQPPGESTAESGNEER